ncbi:MAG TPA: hypothetical protein VML19_01715 [Verrucomicrobiae bacterium]|nr:hypothetical protein [Verrucomicrobiae bacterium]
MRANGGSQGRSNQSLRPHRSHELHDTRSDVGAHAGGRELSAISGQPSAFEAPASWNINPLLAKDLKLIKPKDHAELVAARHPIAIEQKLANSASPFLPHPSPESRNNIAAGWLGQATGEDRSSVSQGGRRNSEARQSRGGLERADCFATPWLAAPFSSYKLIAKS